MPRALIDICRDLIAWFEFHARDLPWRRTLDPYAIWTSEIMLQQTQVKTVIPYWERWMGQFPTIETLAQAAEPKLLKAWEGLGYYSRPRNMQRAAKVIVAQHNGKFPRDYKAVLDLPGIGRYTAGAICSIAFDQPTPLLDGNVARVLSRLFMVSGDVKSPAVRERLWMLSEELIRAAAELQDDGVYSSLNQGLMELGAIICTPKNPQCNACPLTTHCAAFAKNKVEEYPQKAVKKAFRRPLHFAVIVRHGDSVLIRKRATGEVNAGFWEFPMFEAARQKNTRSQLEHFLGFRVAKGKPWHTLRHTITTNRITLKTFYFEVPTKPEALAKKLNSRWNIISRLNQYPFTSAHGKLRKLLLG